MRSGVDLVKAYLENFPVYAAQRFEAYQKQTGRPPKEGNLYFTTLSYVTDAITIGNAGMLGRVFNQYPSRYELEDKSEPTGAKVFYFVDPKIANYWPDAYERLLLQNLFEAEFDTELGANKYHLTDPGKERVRQIIGQIVDFAVDVFLDEKGQIKPFLIEFLKLEPVLDAIQKKIFNLKEVINQILFCYVIQVVNTDVLMPLYDKYQGVGEPEADLRTKVFKQLLALTDYSTSLVASKDENNIWHYTAFFNELITSGLFSKGIYSEDSFVKVMYFLSPEQITQIVASDLAGVHQNLGNQFLDREFLRERGEFWLKVCRILQDSRFFVELQAVYQALPSDLRTIWENSNLTLSLAINTDQLGLDTYRQLLDAKDEMKSVDQAIFKNWLNARDNRFLLNELKRREQGNVGYLSKFFDAQFKPELVQLPTRQFLIAVTADSEHKLGILELLGKYFQSLALELNKHIISPEEQIILPVKLKSWPDVVEILLAQQDKKDLPATIWETLMLNRSSLSRAFKDFLEVLQRDEDRLEYLNKTIGEANLLGKLFKQPYSGWGLYFSPFAKKDEHGNKLTTSMSNLIDMRDILVAKIKPGGP